MKVLLIDVDSKIPNLALMKISAHHKQKGDQVGFNIIDPDVVYGSIVFSKNKWKGNAIKTMYPDVDVIIGGSGYNYIPLSEEIEHIFPDYDLYNCDYSLGFTTRGCIRNCEFCIVPEKEGKIKRHASIYEFWDHKHKHIVLLDNNILALPNWFKEITNQIKSNNLSVDFNQGLDIRLINDDNAKILSDVKVKPDYRFAFDDPFLSHIIESKIDILKKYNISHCLFYVLVGFNTDKDQDLFRLNLLKKWDQRAYVMRYESCNGNQWYNDLSAWANQQQFFMSMNFDKFRSCRHNRRIKNEV